jgi:hypothetical protein
MHRPRHIHAAAAEALLNVLKLPSVRYATVCSNYEGFLIVLVLQCDQAGDLCAGITAITDGAVALASGGWLGLLLAPGAGNTLVRAAGWDTMMKPLTRCMSTTQPMHELQVARMHLQAMFGYSASGAKGQSLLLSDLLFSRALAARCHMGLLIVMCVQLQRMEETTTCPNSVASAWKHIRTVQELV